MTEKELINLFVTVLEDTNCEETAEEICLKIFKLYQELQAERKARAELYIKLQEKNYKRRQ